MMPSLNGNWVDLFIILIFAYYVFEAFRYGLWTVLIDFASFLGALLISLRVYKFTASFLGSNFNLPASFNNALGFILTAIVLEVALGYLFAYTVTKLPKKVQKNKLNRLWAIIPALGEALVLVAFLLTAVTALPVKPEIKKAISESKIGSVVLKQTSGVESAIGEIFGGAINDSLTYFTVKPGSTEKVDLKTGVEVLSVDEAGESQIFALTNAERAKRGIPELTWYPEVVPVARAHARDMWERKYFSHYSPEGKNVGDRLTSAGISYVLAGENLALAPTVQTAHTGLMNSEGHRANILDPRFKRVGIGVIDNGMYGKMFVQVFTD
ncbi:MAG TPA: CvpA family protein [Patescibacteria group bacterium]|nr:CvpA family protein [Patescibacteria group bacterium]